jgi:DNA polymerase (family X)
VERASLQRLPVLVSLDDLRGDMHVAARLGAGPATADALARACHARGYEYCVVLRHARGHGPAGERHADIAATGAHADTVRILHGIIVPIGLDGSLEAAEPELHAADLVVVELRSHLRLSRARMTERLMHALDDTRVDVLIWPPARTAGNGAGADVDSDAVFTAAAARGVALELVPGAVLTDADEAQIRRAAERGVRFALASDARALDALDDVRFAVDAARRGWMEADSVINTAPLPELEQWLLRRASHRAAALASV